MKPRSSETVQQRALAALAWTAIAGSLAGCGASIDMTSAIGAERATMTVPYTGVRAEVRLYPDYGPIDASILADDAAPADEKRPAASKTGKR